MVKTGLRLKSLERSGNRKVGLAFAEIRAQDYRTHKLDHAGQAFCRRSKAAPTSLFGGEKSRKYPASKSKTKSFDRGRAVSLKYRGEQATSLNVSNPTEVSAWQQHRIFDRSEPDIASFSVEAFGSPAQRPLH